MTDVEYAQRRTEYLKKGCKECKRRKIKCDEYIDPPPEAYLKINEQGRELCWQCTRLKKKCVYPFKGEKVLRVSRKVLLEKQRNVQGEVQTEENEGKSPSLEISGTASFQLEPPTIQHLTVPPRPVLSRGMNPSTHLNPINHARPAGYIPRLFPTQPSTDERGFLPMIGANPTCGPSPLVIGLDIFRPSPKETAFVPNVPSTNSSSVSSLSGAGPYDLDDLALLASDLNNLVSDMMYKATDTMRPELAEDYRTSDVSKMDFSPGASKAWSKSYTHIPRNFGIGIFNVAEKEKVYLQEFYLGFASVILPFNAYDPILLTYYNPMRDILFFCAYNEAFMLAAILSQGARSIFLRTNSADDEFAYYQYLQRCLELLGPALGDHMSRNVLKSLPNIEAILLTVLLLTSSNAANIKQNWRPHLRGAKDILLKHTSNCKDMSGSKLLLLCKYWYISFEILAALCLNYGGTIGSDEELDVILNFRSDDEIQVLCNLGLVSHNGFFLLGGFHIELVTAWKDLIKLLNKKRRTPGYKKDEAFEYLRLLAIFEQQRSKEFVNKKAFLKNSDFPGSYVPTGLLLDTISDGPDHIIISWMDVSQQLYCIAASVTLLTEFLGLKHDSPQIQTWVRKLTSYIDFLSSRVETPALFKCAVMMIQWPILVAGLNLVRITDKHLVLRFFDLAMKAGAGSAEYNISRLKSLWQSREAGEAEPVHDDVDVVPY